MGRKVPTSEADNLIEVAQAHLRNLWRWRKTVIKSYETEGVLALPDYWLIHGDNPEHPERGKLSTTGNGSGNYAGGSRTCPEEGAKGLVPPARRYLY